MLSLLVLLVHDNETRQINRNIDLLHAVNITYGTKDEPYGDNDEMEIKRNKNAGKSSKDKNARKSIGNGNRSQMTACPIFHVRNCTIIVERITRPVKVQHCQESFFDFCEAGKRKSCIKRLES